jgi:hypothetical protein
VTGAAHATKFSQSLPARGKGVFSGTFRTTTGIHRRFKPKLLRDFDHPIFVSKGPTALRA